MKKIRYTGASDIVGMSINDWAAAGVEHEDGDVFMLDTRNDEREVVLSDAAADDLLRDGNDFELVQGGEGIVEDLDQEELGIVE